MKLFFMCFLAMLQLLIAANEGAARNCGATRFPGRGALLPDSLAFTIHETNFTGNVVVRKMHHMPGYALELYDTNGKMLDHMMLRRKLYQFAIGDIDGDGKTDICIGIIKKTAFHPEVEKRLFIYRITDGKIVRMWMGSKVTRTLIDFKVLHSGNVAAQIITMEKDKAGKYFIGAYHWSGFGLQLSGYRQRNISYRSARREFCHADN